MTRPLDAVLTTDGTSDRVLVPILQWLLAEHGCPGARIEWLSPGLLPESPALRARIRAAVDLFPCDVLFVHRDAEGEPRTARLAEIGRAIAGLSVPAHVCVVPVRMTEAWLLFDHAAVRRAAGNPNGTVALGLPKPSDAERTQDPKALLHRAVVTASERTGRRREKIRPAAATHQIAELIEDFSPLRSLSAFRALEEDVDAMARRWRASMGPP